MAGPAAAEKPGLDWLLRAHASVTDPAEQRRARVATAILAALLLVGLLAFATSLATGTDAEGILRLIGVLAGVGLAFLLVRQGHATAGTMLALVVVEAFVWLSRLDAAGHAQGQEVLYYLGVALLVAGLLLAPRAAAAFGVATMLSAWLFEALVDQRFGTGLDVEDTTLLIFLGAIAALSVAASAIMQREARLAVAEVSQAAELLREANGKLQETAAQRQRMFQQISHDLANPLSPILIQLGILGRAQPDHDPAASVAVIRRNVDQIKRQVEDLRDLARIEGSRLRLSVTAVDVAALTLEVGESFQEVAQQRQIRLVVEAQGPLVAQGDRGRVAQVLYNLLTNALKFTPAGGTVTVGTQPVDAAVEVRVRDSGRGLSEAQQAQLFRPFTQVHEEGEVKERGTGLGLFICKGIVEAHGGTIGVESGGQGLGATFTFRLPLAQPVAP